MILGILFSGFLSILKSVRLTNAVFGSRSFDESMSKKVANEIVATRNGTRVHKNVDRTLINEVKKRFLSSFERNPNIYFMNDNSQP